MILVHVILFPIRLTLLILLFAAALVFILSAWTLYPEQRAELNTRIRNWFARRLESKA